VLQDFAAEPASASLEIQLDDETLATKGRMLACHATQRRTLAPFTATVERFRQAPEYDFRNLPNGRRLYYETLPFEFRGNDWPGLVDQALLELGLEAA
jgi:hypothetical protein